MNENSADELDRKASKTKTVIFLVIIGAVLLGGLILIQAINSYGTDDMMNNGAIPPTSGVQSPDPVKESIEPNGDNRTSPTGTGPGTENRNNLSSP